MRKDDQAKIRKQAWREKRKARREKQRQENVGRAARMRAARIADSSVLTASHTPSHTPALGCYVGCSGWFYWHWRRLFYPDSIPTSQWFQHYAKQFRTVELNAPFYSWPTIATVKTWLQQAHKSKNFIYTVKVSELITHTRRFRGTKLLIRDFGYIADLLGSRMGCFLFQLPPSFHFTPARLKAIVEQLDHSRRNVVEFRHSSWWNQTVYKTFRQAGIIFCSCSAPNLPEELIKTADDIYIRFHGTARWYRHDYSAAQVAVWAIKIKDSGAARVWAYFNNDREGFAIQNAKKLLKLLK